jgi:SAM-dependent methyltransferase
MSLQYNKVIDAADFHNGELIPFLREILYDEQVKFGLEEPIIVADSKAWECGMMLRAFSDHGLIKPGATFAGIGAGIEQTTFSLAAKDCVVFPSDRYLEVTPWSDVAPAGMLIDAAQYTNFRFSRGNVIPVHSDARWLNLPSGFFDGVYSAGSIEHVGSLNAIAAVAEEIGRILKPGGMACLSTEFKLMGPNDKGWFDDNCILFTPDLIRQYILDPSGLEFVDQPNFKSSQETFDQRVVLLDFLEKARSVSSIEDKKNAYPNLTLFHEGFLFCSIHLALRKPLCAVQTSALAHRFSEEVEANAKRSSSIVARQIGDWTTSAQVGEVIPVTSHSYDSSTVVALEARIDQLLNSRSMRLTQPIRSVVHVVRRTPGLRRLASSMMRTIKAIRNMLRSF